MNPLLWVAGGGLGAYLLLRDKTAHAAALAPTGVSTPSVQAPNPSRSPVDRITSMPRLPNPTDAMITEIAAGRRSLAQLAGKWVWPVPRWQGRAPVISDGFGSPRPGSTHAGVDVMFGRIASDPFPVGSPNGSKHFVMPDAWMAVAASDGVLWSAGHTSRGFAVVLDHGHVATFYTHLETLFVPQIKPPAKGTNPAQLVQVKAGQPLGVIGADPKDGQRLKHLHFELWMGGPADTVDPKPIMSTWQVPTTMDLAPFLSAMTRNAKRKGEAHPDLVRVVEHFRAWPGTALHKG